MTTSQAQHPITWRTAMRAGAVTGASLTFGYALLFGVFAILVTSGMILSTASFGPLATLAANSVTLLYLVLIFALLFSILTALIGSITGLIVYGLDRWLNSRNAPLRAALIGVLTATGVWLVLYWLILQAGLGQRLGWAYPAAFTFWLVLPGLVYVCAAGIAGVRLNTQTVSV